MSFENEFIDLMPHTLKVYAKSGYNEYGKPSYSTSYTSYSSLEVKKHNLVVTKTGAEKLSTTTVYVASTAVIDTEYKIALNDGSIPAILSVGLQSDDDGAHHNVIYCG